MEKICRILKDGRFLKEIKQRDPFFELQRIFKQRYRFTSTALQRRCRRITLSHFHNRLKIESVLENTLGTLAGFARVVSPESRLGIIAQADVYMQRRFDILGSGDIILDPIDWHTDFKSGFRWPPGTFYHDYVQVDLSNNADVKVPRELSRCHHFLVLGQAFLLTGDERYTEEFLRQIRSFIDNNPLMRSINWGCTMDVAIRAVNWIWALALFRESAVLSKDVLVKIMTSLYEHGHFIYHNPEIMHYPENRHNHYIADLAGQIYLGLLFRGLPEADTWLKKGVRSFFLEMRLQILPSGPTYERSTNYHRLVLEMFCSTIVMLDRNDHEIPADIWYRLEKMFEFVMYYIRPDGQAPIIGDQDNGRFHPFGLQDINDHRYLLAIGAILFNRPDFKKYSSGYTPDCFFLLGAESKKNFDAVEQTELNIGSKRFPDAGFYIMRSDNDYMFINISGKGKYNEIPTGTHTHSDLLSFELSVAGIPFIIDPGSYLYSADPGARKQFRSTCMHNTVAIDGQDQNVLKKQELWNFERNALPRLLAWESFESLDVFSAEHTGYLRLESPVLHRRTIRFHKLQKKWAIEDRITGSGKHTVECFFHFNSGIDFTINGTTVTTTLQQSNNISLAFCADRPLELEKESGFISKSYGHREQALILRVSMQADCPTWIATEITIAGN